ncbi:hypothetical protein AAC387_Pa04g2127 [Persea americana]
MDDRENPNNINIKEGGLAIRLLPLSFCLSLAASNSSKSSSLFSPTSSLSFHHHHNSRLLQIRWEGLFEASALFIHWRV